MRKAAARDLGSRPLEGTALTNQGAQYPLIKEYAFKVIGALIVWFKANSVIKEYTLNYGVCDTWRVGGLGKQVFYRLISIITPN